MKYNLGDKLTINGVVFTVVDEGNQVKSPLSEIISEGQSKMHNAVEAVIAKHEREIKLECDVRAILEGNHRDWRIQAAAVQAAQSCEYLGLSARQAQGIQNISLSDYSGLLGQSSAQYGSALSAGGWL